ncbi:MAG: hypothetical protein AB7N76_28355 [Planctomycetota bacterium]
MGSIATRRVRGEGHAEYIVITAMLMICALVGFFGFISEVKHAAEKMAICFQCEPSATGNQNLGNADSDSDGGLLDWLRRLWGDDTRTETTTNADGTTTTVQVPWWRDPTDIRYYFLRMAAVVGGGPHLWDYLLGW